MSDNITWWRASYREAQDRHNGIEENSALEPIIAHSRRGLLYRCIGACGFIGCEQVFSSNKSYRRHCQRHRALHAPRAHNGA
ncbi:hypothetical protein FRC18_000728 [Serendipita sp. 400]|nr:hypothetical protein FRC18_000728 [Serendipita sp. 400]